MLPYPKESLINKSEHSVLMQSAFRKGILGSVHTTGWVFALAREKDLVVFWTGTNKSDKRLCKRKSSKVFTWRADRVLNNCTTLHSGMTTYHVSGNPTHNGEITTLCNRRPIRYKISMPVKKLSSVFRELLMPLSMFSNKEGWGVGAGNMWGIWSIFSILSFVNSNINTRPVLAQERRMGRGAGIWHNIGLLLWAACGEFWRKHSLKN